LKGNFRIADWEVEPEINCLRTAGRAVHIEPKIMQVLVQLASHSNEVLSKDHLMHAVWPDTFVSEDVLTRCISELRRVFADDARAPRFIQTIPKTGYRLIADVTPAGLPISGTQRILGSAGNNGSSRSEVAVATAESPTERTTVSEPSTGKPSQLRWVITLAVLVVAVASVVFYRWWQHRPTAIVVPEGGYKTVPFTSDEGAQVQPSFSPDGNQVAFAWSAVRGSNRDIYLKLLDSENPLRLTSGGSDNFSPVWSPDSRSIAFMSNSDTDRGIYIVPAIGGPARKVYTPKGTIEWNRGTLAWSPDGKQLIFPDGKSAGTSSSIYALSLDTLQADPITTPPKYWDGDVGAVFSPDGTRIAFLRAIDAAVRDIYIMDANGGVPQRITTDNRFVNAIAWSRDGQSLVFSSDRGGKFSLWRIPVSGGAPLRLPVGGEDAFSPSIAPRGDRMVYAQSSSKWSIVQLKLDPTSAKEPPAPVLSSTQQDSAPQISPDGTHIAFQSWRSGTQEIWVASSNGSDLAKLTSFERSLTGSPAWSPDGKQIAFDSRPNGHSHIFVIGAQGGPPKQITDGESNDIVPSWSPDGKWIYFGSNRIGSWQIWKVSSSGGDPQQVTRNGGFVAIASLDGQYIYYARADAAGIWRIPVNGGNEVQVAPQPRVGYWGYWTVAKQGLYYLNSTTTPNTVDLATPDGRVLHERKLQATPPPFAGITVSPDGKSLLYTDLTEVGSHLTLVENFK
jgi:Tol biopolymer transport system component/DNA-binding winged helix-turn-helix (wHTH) protein